MKKKRLFITVLISTILITNIFPIGFGFHAFKIRTSPEFSKGVYPTSLLYQFDFPIPDFIVGNTSQLSFRIDNGLSFRTLRQHPTDGTPFAINPNTTEWHYPKDYLTLYNEMNLVIGQGFLKTSFSDKDLFKLWCTFDIRFENAYERLEYLYDEKNRDGLFIDNFFPTPSPRFTSWIGQPELSGSHSTSNISFSIGFDLDMMEDKITRRNGIKNSFWTRLNPIWTDWFQDGSHDFLLIWDKLDLAFTPLSINMNGKRDTTWFSIVFDNSTIYRFIMGNKIPYYVQGGDIFGTQSVNTEHVLTNRTSITFYGPQINSYDCYPYLTAFIDIGISLGNLLNSSNSMKFQDIVASTGFRAEFVIFDIASFYYEYGYIFNNVLNTENSTVMRFGFSFGV